MAMQVIGPDGFKIATTDFDPQRTLEPGPPAQPPLDAPLRIGLRAGIERPYAPGIHLWPVSWSPTFAFTSTDEDSNVIGLEMAGNDPVGLHSITGRFNAIPEEGALKAELDYVFRGFRPRLNLGLRRETRTRETGAFYGLQRNPHRENVTALRLGAAASFSVGEWSASANTAYSLSATEPAKNVDPAHDPLDPAPRIPEASRSALVAFNVALSNVQSFDRAISKEKGRAFNLSLRLRRPELGGDYDTAEILYGYREYIPIWRRHVLAFKVDGALGRGDTGRRIFYALGAPVERNIFLDAIDQIFFGSTMLRGYPASTEKGNRYLLSTLSYRIPIIDIFRGLDTVPLFLRRFKLSVFTDWAQARSEALHWRLEGFRRSVGFEFVTDATIGWRLPVIARTGYARGLDADGENQIYFFMGRWF
jgi:hypothetical protein